MKALSQPFVSRTSALSPRWLRWLVIFLVVVGVVFRFVNLNHKVYWHDEVYTSLRAAGYTGQEIGQAIFQNQLFAAKDLLRFQQIKPGSTPADTVRSLAIEDPQHPPLYFLMDRFWVQWFGAPIAAVFGSPLTASRLLPALISLLSLPLMYALAWELFASPVAALLATALLSLSPFDVLFAQVARQYSLLTLTVIASHWLLLRAMRLSTVSHSSRDRWARSLWRPWGWYAIAVAVGLYTHPFFGLATTGQAVYVILEAIANRQKVPLRERLSSFGFSLIAAIVLYAPWLVVLVTGFRRALATTNWADTSAGVAYLVKLWTLSFTALFLDLDFGFDNPWTFLFRVPFLVLIGLALYTVCRRCDRAVWLFVLTSILVPFLALALPDLIAGSRRSAVSRYLIACYPGVQLAIAYLLATHLSRFSGDRLFKPLGGLHSRLIGCRQWLWRSVFLLLATASIASCTVSAASFTWWHNVPSYFNADIARRVNAVPSVVLVSDQGDDFTNLGDLISLSYKLNPTVRLLLVSQNAHWVETATFKAQIQDATVITFRPSGALRQALERSYGPLQPLLPAAQLWQVPGI